MVDSPAEVTADAIIAAGLGSAGGVWPVGVSREPVGDPVNVITTFDTGGSDPLNLEVGLRRPTVQVRVRSSLYSDGWQKADAILETLGTTYGALYADNRVVGFVPRGDVLFVGRNDQDNFLFTINLELMKGREP